MCVCMCVLRVRLMPRVRVCACRFLCSFSYSFSFSQAIFISTFNSISIPHCQLHVAFGFLVMPLQQFTADKLLFLYPVTITTCSSRKHAKQDVYTFHLQDGNLVKGKALEKLQELRARVRGNVKRRADRKIEIKIEGERGGKGEEKAMER